MTDAPIKPFPMTSILISYIFLSDAAYFSAANENETPLESRSDIEYDLIGQLIPSSPNGSMA
jgi:hypothetical protein